MIKHIIPLFLFFLLTPGILWTYSKKHNKYSIALLHACVFAFVFYLIESYTPIREGLAKNDKRLSFALTQDDVKDNELKRKIKKVYGAKTEIASSGKKEKKNYIILSKRDNKDEFDIEPITREDIMEMPNNQKINDFIKKYE